MNKEKLWFIFASLNPSLADPRLRLEPESVRKIFDTTWNEAYEAGAKDMEARIKEISQEGPTPMLAGTIEEFLNAIASKPNADKNKKSPKKADPGAK